MIQEVRAVIKSYFKSCADSSDSSLSRTESSVDHDPEEEYVNIVQALRERLAKAEKVIGEIDQLVEVAAKVDKVATDCCRTFC